MGGLKYVIGLRHVIGLVYGVEREMHVIGLGYGMERETRTSDRFRYSAYARA